MTDCIAKSFLLEIFRVLASEIMMKEWLIILLTHRRNKKNVIKWELASIPIYKQLEVFSWLEQ